MSCSSRSQRPISSNVSGPLPSSFLDFFRGRSRGLPSSRSMYRTAYSRSGIRKLDDYRTTVELHAMQPTYRGVGLIDGLKFNERVALSSMRTEFTNQEQIDDRTELLE